MPKNLQPIRQITADPPNWRDPDSGGGNLQPKKGLLISFDGIDSSGKETQAKLLIAHLRDKGWTVQSFQSPDYSTESGRELKLLLQNKHGQWDKTPWEQKMKLFAANRAEHRQKVEQALTRGEIVVYDRYVPSSLAFITVEALEASAVESRRNEAQSSLKLRRDKVHQIVERYEYQKQGMPKEDISIFLDVPPRLAGDLLEKRKEELIEEDEYSDHLHIQQQLYDEYDFLCTSQPDHYIRIRCLAGLASPTRPPKPGRRWKLQLRLGRRLHPVDHIAHLIWQALTVKFPILSSTNV